MCGLLTMTPEFHYEHVHSVPSVTQEFLDFLSGDGMDFDVYASATYALPDAKIATSNQVVAGDEDADLVVPPVCRFETRAP